MAVFHKFDDPEELKGLFFESFVPFVVNGELDQDTIEFLECTIEALAEGENVQTNSEIISNLINDFISGFTFDDINGGYRFICGNTIAEGMTTPIKD